MASTTPGLSSSARAEPADRTRIRPPVSHHLKILVDAGLLRRDKRGIWSFYSLIPGALDELARVLSPST
jgi:hypothetical protein